jgi:hypothetical protein
MLWYGRLKFNLELGISDSGIRALLRIESLVEARAATTGNQRHDRVIRLVRTRHARTHSGVTPTLPTWRRCHQRV